MQSNTLLCALTRTSTHPKPKINRRGVIHKNMTKMNTTTAVVQQNKRIKCRLLNIKSLSLLVNQLISHHHIDLLCLTKSWQSHEDYVSLNKSAPPSYLRVFIKFSP